MSQLTITDQLNAQADKLNRPHFGDPGNQWRQLDSSQFPAGLSKDDVRQGRFAEGYAVHEGTGDFVVFFASNKNDNA